MNPHPYKTVSITVGPRPREFWLTFSVSCGVKVHATQEAAETYQQNPHHHVYEIAHFVEK